MTFAPGVGLVRVETIAEVKGKRIPQARLELVSFRIKGATSRADPSSPAT
jgi:hypothetical protein